MYWALEIGGGGVCQNVEYLGNGKVPCHLTSHVPCQS